MEETENKPDHQGKRQRVGETSEGEEDNLDVNSSKENILEPLKGEDGSFYFKLSDDHRRVSVKAWKDKVYIDIREYYQPQGSDDWKPGKKGISLTVDQLKALKDLIPSIEKQVKSLSK